MPRKFRKRPTVTIDDQQKDYAKDNPILKLWLSLWSTISKSNINFRRYAFIIVIITIVALFSGYLYNDLLNQHNKLFFTYLKQYNDIDVLKNDKEKQTKFKQLLEQAQKTCTTFLSTKQSYHSSILL